MSNDSARSAAPGGSQSEFIGDEEFPLLEQNKFVDKEKVPDFDPEYVKKRSKWVRSSDQKVIDSRNAATKLGQLGFDPIETMVRKFDEIQELIDQMLLKAKPSMVALTTLYGIQQKISSDLMKYGYNQVSERPPESTEDTTPTRIILTDD
jgi:ribosomal protein L17